MANQYLTQAQVIERYTSAAIEYLIVQTLTVKLARLMTGE